LSFQDFENSFQIELTIKMLCNTVYCLSTII